MSTTAAAQAVTGSCLCGAVEYAITLPTLWCAHCHCSQCRRFHGAGYVTWVGVAEQQFILTGGEHLLRWYESSPGAGRGFCGRCGSSLLFRSRQWPGEMHVTLASLHAEIDRQPHINTYFSTHVSWMPVDQDLPCKG